MVRRDDTALWKTSFMLCSRSPSGLAYKTAGYRGRWAIGDAAGHMKQDGYWHVSIKGKLYLAHRVVFFLAHGWVPEVLDHADTDKSNNALSNLRPADDATNQWNVKLSPRNTTGVKGLSYDKHSERWAGAVTHNGKVHTLRSPDRTQVENWLIVTRANLHGEFTNHGTSAKGE